MSEKYGAESISILKGLEPVQKRPGMYVGDVSSIDATHHLVYEIFDNAVDEALAGHADQVDLEIFEDGSIQLRDNGRGMPVDIHPDAGISAAEVILTTLHAGGKFDNDAYEFSGGLHGVGAAVVNALSDWLEIAVARDGKLWTARFEHGATIRPISPERSLKKGESNGTTIRFKPSAKYLAETEVERDVLLRRVREVAFLNARLTIRFRDERSCPTPCEELCHYENGMADFVDFVAGDGKRLAPVAHFKGRHEGTSVDIALTWLEEDRPEDLRAYTNNIPQAEGGQHVTGLRSALTKVLMARAEELKIARRTVRLVPDDLREAMVGAMHLHLHDPAFSSQTKEKLISVEARQAVEAVLLRELPLWLDHHPEETRLILSRAQAAAEARQAAKRAREISHTKKTPRRISSAQLPEKLSDCSARDTARRELFLVEGDSAGGSAKQGRDREIQAILPLRGKILNVERAKLAAALKNEEIKGLIQTIGVGFGKDLDLSRLRYDKIVIMTDADVDGSHIATLILTLFFRKFRALIEGGHLYLAAPPLYRLRRKGEEDLYLASEQALTASFVDRALSSKALKIDGKPAAGKRWMARLEEVIALSRPTAMRPQIADLLIGLAEVQDLFEGSGLSERKRAAARKALEARLSVIFPDAQWAVAIDPVPVEAFTLGEPGFEVALTQTEDGVSEEVRFGPAELTDRSLRAARSAWLGGAFHGHEIEVDGRVIDGPFGLVEALRAHGAKGAMVSRYKGLGEMNPAELWETTMDPARRTLNRVTIAQAEAAEDAVSSIMGNPVETRRRLVEEICGSGKDVISG